MEYFVGSLVADKSLYEGRPAGIRLKKEMDTYDMLDSLGIRYFRLDHGAAGTIEDCVEIDRLLGVHMCKNLFLTNAGGTVFYLLMLPGNKKLSAGKLAKQIHSSKISFAGAGDMIKYMKTGPGSVSVLGLMNDTGGQVRLLMDCEISGNEFIGCHPCVNTSSLKIRTVDLMKRFLPFIGHEPAIVEL